MSPTTIGTKALAKRICPVVTGVTESCSNVPCSRSRATDRAESTTVCSIESITMSPGMMNHCVMLLGL